MIAHNDGSDWLSCLCDLCNENYLTNRNKRTMKSNELHPSKYLQSADFPTPRVLTVAGVRMESMKKRDGTTEDKPVVYFREGEKGWVAPKVSTHFMFQHLGEDTDDWTGKQVEVFFDPSVTFGVETVGGIRCRMPELSQADEFPPKF